MSFQNETEIQQFKQLVEDSSEALKERFARIDAEIRDMKLDSERRAAMGGHPVEYGTGRTFASRATETINKSMDHLDRHGSLRVEVKAAGDLITTANVGNTRNVGLGSPSAMPIGLQFAGRAIESIGATSVEYSRYLGTEGDAGVQATEGGTKSALRGNWLLVNQPSITVAGYSNVSRQALHDTAQLNGAISNVMSNSLNKAVDDLLWSGSSGLFAGYVDLATTHQSEVFDVLVDAVAEGIAVMQEAGSNPTAVAVSPTTWVSITTAKASGSGEYLTGAYLGAPTMMMHGLPVVLSLSVPNDRAVLVDANAVELVVTQNPVIEVGYKNDDFIKNQAVLLIETRVAPVIKASAALLYVMPEGATDE